MIDPYRGIDWQSVSRIGSATHMHIVRQESLENGHRYGIRHFPISNYYPSAPYDEQTRPSDFRLQQHWPAKKTNGESIEPPINWNDVITWQEELDEPYRSELPFKEGDRAFSSIPSDVILSPNAEHHGFSNSPSHICCPGSNFISGNIDPQGDKFRLKEHGFCVGFGGTWQKAFEGMLLELKYGEGGGITINHPTWFSKLSDEHVLEMLDFDERVLGIEIYNDSTAQIKWQDRPNYVPPNEPSPGFSLKMWDRILSTGRTCWGFCVPDHMVEKGANWEGRSILLVSEFTELECLKAYREGRFYNWLKDDGLTVTGFAATETSISVQTNQEAAIKFIADGATALSLSGRNATYDLPSKDGTSPTYVRVEVGNESGERLFLQPVVYKPK